MTKFRQIWSHWLRSRRRRWLWKEESDILMTFNDRKKSRFKNIFSGSTSSPKSLSSSPTSPTVFTYNVLIATSISLIHVPMGIWYCESFFLPKTVAPYKLQHHEISERYEDTLAYFTQGKSVKWQWLWLNWQTGCFQHLRSTVRIKSTAWFSRKKFNVNCT